MFDQDIEARVRAMSPAKALAIAAYGESVASYRYRTLAETVNSDQLRAELLKMAEEERGHHGQVQSMLDADFPGSDFVLTAEDKDLVIVGTRTLELHESGAIRSAIDQICDSERRTGSFYAALRNHPGFKSCEAIFSEMADECLDHAERLRALPID